MRWKYGILTTQIRIEKAGSKYLYPKGTPILIGGEEFVQNKMVWQIRFDKHNTLYLDKHDALLCTKEEANFAKFLLNIT